MEGWEKGVDFEAALRKLQNLYEITFRVAMVIILC